MNGAADGHPHEIIIVKHRGGDHEDGHHGGAWKIAFADFMTAMMCFFLVMWLINAANEETKAAVASYFNPVKLIDRNSNRRGLEDLGSGPQSQDETSSADAPLEQKPVAKGMSPASAPKDEKKEEKAEQTKDAAAIESNFFADPYAVLAEIAAETGQSQNISEKGDGGAQVSGPATGAAGGEAYRDPFAPDFWSQEVAPAQRTQETVTEGTPDAAVTTNESVARIAPEAGSGTPQPEPATTPAEPPSDLPKTDQLATAPQPEQMQPAPVPMPRPEPTPAERSAAEAAQTAAAGKASTGPSAADKRTAEAIAKALEDAFGPNDKLAGGIAVVPDKGGVRISMTDQLDYGMFEIGSARPRRDLVLAMEKIARILNTYGGRIAVHGHTDARPFSSPTYDNWRLSSARAQSAYYMLVRGGVDEKRFGEIAGYADRELKVPDKPFDDTNRRIEILVETGG